MQNWEEEPPYDWASEIGTACQCRNVGIFSLVPIIHLAKLLPKSWLLLCKFFNYFLFAPCNMWHFPDQVSNLYPLQWKHGILPTGLPKEVQDWLLESASSSEPVFPACTFVPMPYLCPQLTQTHNDLTGFQFSTSVLQLTELFYTSQLEVSQSKNLIVQGFVLWYPQNWWLANGFAAVGPTAQPWSNQKCVYVCFWG